MINQDQLQQLIDEVEQLSLDDQEILLEILNRKISDKRNLDILQEIQEVRNDFKQGNVRPVSANEFIEEISLVKRCRSDR